MAEFDGLSAIVTGGASGIGAATAELIAERGGRVAVLDIDPAGSADSSNCYYCDVTSDESVSAAVRNVVSDLGGIDILVNNAGIGVQGTVVDNDIDEWRRIFDVNILGIVRVTREAIPSLKLSPCAAIVNTGSILATVGFPNRAAYGASKGAVLALTLAMAADYVQSGIRVNCVAPGTADTPWISALLSKSPDPDAERISLIERQPMGRLVTANEVAHAIAYLASPLAGSTTGTVLRVDSGIETVRTQRLQPIAVGTSARPPQS